MTYDAACGLICATFDNDGDEIRHILNGLRREDLEHLAIQLAVMTPPDAMAPKAFVDARTRYLGLVHTITVEPAAWLDVIIADMFNVDARHIRGPSRNREAVDARHVYCWVRHTVDHVSFSEVGREVAKDHTTVMNAVRRVNQSPALRAKASLVLERRRTAIRGAA